MAVEQHVPTDADKARDAAINEFRLAILALQCGEITSARNHGQCALAWTSEAGL